MTEQRDGMGGGGEERKKGGCGNNGHTRKDKDSTTFEREWLCESRKREWINRLQSDGQGMSLKTRIKGVGLKRATTSRAREGEKLPRKMINAGV